MAYTYLAQYEDFIEGLNVLSPNELKDFLEEIANVSLKYKADKIDWQSIQNWGGAGYKPEYDSVYFTQLNRSLLKVSKHPYLKFWVREPKNVLRMLYNFNFKFQKENNLLSRGLKSALSHFRTKDKYSKSMLTFDSFLFCIENGRVRQQGNYEEGKKQQKLYKNKWQDLNYSVMAILQTGKTNAQRSDLRDVVRGHELFETMAGKNTYIMELHHILFTNGASHDKTEQPSVLFSTKPTHSSLVEMLKLVPVTPSSHKAIHNTYRSANIKIYDEFWEAQPDLKPYYLRGKRQYNRAIGLVVAKLQDTVDITVKHFPSFEELMIELSKDVTIEVSEEN